ncbi:hypothetical protein BST97_12875 [Nonlabens spongiae]|uniref:Uncharacterized protein n=2 Tax=Nonlabens spongiae TaxID=331648 RepID=A0A1W6MMI5_9FLAO|nr:hypothetical protein BST97_12875 [Nonlabens spongiae]
MSITHTSLSRLSKSAPEVYDRSLSLALSDSKFTKSAGDSTSLVLDTTNVYITEGLDYKNYIFRVEPDANSPADELKNLMIVRLRDSLTHQYLVTYKMLDAVTIDTTDVKIEGFFAEDLSGHVPMKCGGTETVMTWVEGYMVSYNCTNGGDHSPGESCAPGESRWGQAYEYFVPGHYDVQFIEQEPCDSFEDPNASSNTTGAGDPNGSGNEDDDDEDDDPESIGIDVVPNRELPGPVDPECKYLMDLLNDNSFKSHLSDLRSSANREEYEEIYEFTRGINDATGTLDFYSDSGSASKPTAPVRTLARNEIRVIMIHTHPKARQGYSNHSMFSYTDIDIFLKDITKVNLSGQDNSQMTNIIVTVEGGKINMYALKKAPNSDIANNYLAHQQSVLGMTEDERKDERDNYEEAIKNAFYDLDPQKKMEFYALRQLKKMGLHLYKSDNEHTSWQRMTLESDPSKPNGLKLGSPESCD